MKTKRTLRNLLAATTLLATLLHPLSTCLAQGTAFTYQGRLNGVSGPVSGSYDLAFTLYNTNATGLPASGTVTNTATAVSNGLFTVTLDFGGTPYAGGAPLWLQIGARTNGAASFSPLTPRQAVLPTPYALYAESSDATNLAGTIGSANLPNGLGGSGNTASGADSLVAGGGGNQVDSASSYSTIGAGNANSIANTLYATIGGGNQNVINNVGGFGTIGGGNGNFIANTLDGTIAGGYHNVITNGATFAAVGGGNGNAIGGGFDSVIGGGFQNYVNASFATVPGGANNSATANYSFAAGDQAQAVNTGAFVWADSQGVSFSSTNNNSFNVRAQGGARFVTSGAGLSVDGPVTSASFSGSGTGLTGVALLGSANTFTSGNQIITGGNVGIGTASPFTQLANTANNIYGSDGFGLGSQSLGWYSTTAGYTAGFYNSWNNPSGDGIVVSITHSSSRIMDLLSGGNSVMAVNGNGNVGIGTNTPSTALQVIGTITANNFVGPYSAAQLTSVGNGNSGSTGDFFIGTAGNSTTTGSFNTADGYQALYNTTTANNNTADGYQALYHDTTGGANTAGGLQALFNNTNGIQNTAYGEGALNNNTSGSGNIALGYQAGYYLTTGSSNIDIGNPGLASDANLIRIGSGQTSTYLAGVITGGTTFSGTEIVTNGSVGIGTTSPQVGLEVDSTVYGQAAAQFDVANCGAPCAQTDYQEAIRLWNQNANGQVGLGFLVGGASFISNAVPDVWIGTHYGASGSANDFKIATRTNSTATNLIDRVYVNGTTGRVGIGTDTPAAGLDVEVSAAVSDGTWSYFGKNALNTNSLSGSPSLAIFTSGNIGASTYYAFSDARIKNLVGQSDSATDLKTLLGLKITDYTFKDTVAHGNGQVKKVVAQQVESVYPQAVSQTTGVVPDIFQQASQHDGWVKLATDLKVGERVKLVTENGQGIYQVLETREGAFRTDFTPNTEQVFVYGREVRDFRSVDYEALGTLNISATQELARKLDAQQAALARLQDKLNQTLAEKETLLKHLAALEARDQAREDRLARLESSLEKGSARASYAALNQQY